MSKPTTNRVRVETWNVAAGRQRAYVEKVAVRNHLGQFHGSTNFRGSVLKTTSVLGVAKAS